MAAPPERPRPAAKQGSNVAPALPRDLTFLLLDA